MKEDPLKTRNFVSLPHNSSCLKQLNSETSEHLKNSTNDPPPKERGVGVGGEDLVNEQQSVRTDKEKMRASEDLDQHWRRPGECLLEEAKRRRNQRTVAPSRHGSSEMKRSP